MSMSDDPRPLKKQARLDFYGDGDGKASAAASSSPSSSQDVAAVCAAAAYVAAMKDLKGEALVYAIERFVLLQK
jgi:hypothetical protein